MTGHFDLFIPTPLFFDTIVSDIIKLEALFLSCAVLPGGNIPV